MVHMDSDEMRELLVKYDLAVQELPGEETVRNNFEKNLKSSFKGRERGSNGEAVRSGVMSVERDEEADKYSVYAIFNMKKDAADDLYRTVFNNGEEDPDNLRNKIISNFINSIGCYRGDF